MSDENKVNAPVGDQSQNQVQGKPSETVDQSTGNNLGVRSETGVSDDEKAKMNKAAEEQALDHAAAKTDGSAAVHGEGVKSETKADVFFEGRKVVRILPKEQQNQKNFVHSEMSDGTTVHVPAELFDKEDVAAINDKAADALEQKAEETRKEASDVRDSK